MKVNIDKAKQELLSGEKLTLPKWVIFIGFMSNLAIKPVAILAYIPVILHAISLLTGSEYNLLDSLVAVLVSMCLLVFLASTAMKNMNEDGVLELYLSLIFETDAFPKFLKSKFQNNHS